MTSHPMPARNAQIVALHQAGHSLRAIGREVKLSHEGVRLVLIAAGLGLPDRPIGRPRNPPLDVRRAWKLYQTRSLSQVAELLGTNHMEVSRAFKQAGLPARPRGRPTKAFQRRGRVTPPRVKRG